MCSVFSDDESKKDLYDLFINKTDSQDLETICYEKLRLLLESDERDGTEYFKTLYTYLENGNSYIRTAEKLFIHRNTVFQRMKKISELLQADFSDFSVACEYYTMLTILKKRKGVE